MNNEALFVATVAVLLAWITYRLYALGVDWTYRLIQSREQRRTGDYKSSDKTTR
jgi:hypothetical protein